MIENDMALAIDVLAPKLGGSGNDLTYLLGTLNFWNDLNEATETPRLDYSAFNLLEMIGIEPRGASIEEVTWMLSTAYLYVCRDSWLYYDWSYENYNRNIQGGYNLERGASAFEHLVLLNKMKQEGKSEEEINQRIYEYWTEFTCAGFLKTRNKELLRVRETMREVYIPPMAAEPTIIYEYENVYHYMLCNYERILDNIAADFKSFYESTMEHHYEK